MAQKLNGTGTSKRGRQAGAAAKNTTTTTAAPAPEGKPRSAETANAPAPVNAMSNVTDDTITDFWLRALKAKTDLEEAQKGVTSANGVYRGVLKEAKKAGIDPDDIVWRLNQRNRSPEEIDAETKRRNRIAMLTKLPIGTQLGMFGEGQSVATASENRAAAAPAKKPIDGKVGDDTAGANAYNQGYASAKAGSGIERNPHGTGSAEHDQWADGWSDYQQDQAAAAGAAQSGGAAGDVFGAQA